MPINLDQTGPAHLLSTDDDGLILNGSPVISKSIHVSDTQPYTYLGDVATKLLWLDTGTQGVSAFPLGGAANWILRTDGQGTVSWVPPSSIDATKFHYKVSDDVFVTNPGSGYVRFPRSGIDPMSTTTNLVVSAYSIARSGFYTDIGEVASSFNDISGFINGLVNYGNNNRRGFIKIEKENDPNHFQIYEFKTITDRVGWFEIGVSVVQASVEDQNFSNDDPVSITFSVSGPQAVSQDLSNYVNLTGTQTLLLKNLNKPLLREPFIIDDSLTLTGVSIAGSGVINANPFNLSSVGIGNSGAFSCTTSSLNINDRIYVSGVNSGTGTITGYNSAGTMYYIVATNGTTEFTLSETLGGSPISSSNGTTSGAIVFTRVVYSIHDVVRISGINGGTGTIAGYDDAGSIYYIIATNGRDQFTLSSTLGGSAIATTAGTVTGAMTFTARVGSSITFEDSFTSGGFETKLTVVKSSADHKIVLPDATTTLVGIDNAQLLTNKTITQPVINDPTINVTSNTANLLLTSDVATTFNSSFNTTANDRFNWATNLVYNGTTWAKDDANRGGWLFTKKAVGTANADNEISLSFIAFDDTTLSNKFKLNGDGQLSLPIVIPSTTTSTGTLVVAGGVGIAGTANIGGNLNLTGTLEAGSIQSTPIGSIFTDTGAFTTLSATGIVTVSNATETTAKNNGAVVITGGLGVGKAVRAKGPVWLNDLDPLETELSGYSLVVQNPQAKVRIGPNYTTGAVDYVDILTLEDNPTITTTSDNLSIENLQNLSAITLTATGGSVVITANTASTTKTTGALKVVGGIGVEGQIRADDIYVYGQTGLSNTASQVVSLAATQTLTNKTLTAPTVNNTVLTGTVQAGGSVGLLGQLLSSTVTGVAWVNPVSVSAMVYYKASDQSFFPSGTVTLPAGPQITVGSGFGSMANDGSGTFTFSVTGTYQVSINYSIDNTNGVGYPVAEFWIRKNGVDTIKYCQLLSDGMRRGTVSEIIEFANNDTLTWYINSQMRVNGGSPSATGSRLTILRIS